MHLSRASICFLPWDQRRERPRRRAELTQSPQQAYREPAGRRAEATRAFSERTLPIPGYQSIDGGDYPEYVLHFQLLAVRSVGAPGYHLAL
jgi:hypothetical protein